MQRRTLIALLGACGAAAAFSPAAAHPTWEGLRASRERMRRHAAHRTLSRVVQGRVMWLVPAGLAVGWDLLHEQRRMRVDAIWQVERDGAPRELARLVDRAGLARELEILRVPAGSPPAG